MTKKREKKVNGETKNTTQRQERKQVKARGANQQSLMESIEDNFITLAVGPAGCGKTHVSVGMAVKFLLEKKVRKIIITRPTITVDEDLGYLPGDLNAKMNPFLIPLYDELSDFATPAEIKFWLENDILQIVAIGHLRGRTIKNSFVILDEAQNATTKQLKMFTTRYGNGSRFIINGDHSQSDLPYKSRGGLKTCLNILDNKPGIGIIELTETDIVRHQIVQTIVEAFDKYERANDSEAA